MSLEAVFETYKELQTAHPIIGNMLIAEVTYPIASIVSQLIETRKVDFDRVKYYAKIGPVYGLMLYGLMKTGDAVGATVSENPFLKSALGPNLWGNFFNIQFFVNDNYGEHNEFSVKKLLKFYKETFIAKGDNLKEKVENLYYNLKENYYTKAPKKSLKYATFFTFTLWNAFQTWNYEYVADEMRTPIILATGIVWAGIMSTWAIAGNKNLDENPNS
jgi:hypothetical protein